MGTPGRKEEELDGKRAMFGSQLFTQLVGIYQIELDTQLFLHHHSKLALRVVPLRIVSCELFTGMLIDSKMLKQHHCLPSLSIQLLSFSLRIT
jgi:hypothetical protein